MCVAETGHSSGRISSVNVLVLELLRFLPKATWAVSMVLCACRRPQEEWACVGTAPLPAPAQPLPHWG